MRDILFQLGRARDSALVVSFLWVPSHVGLIGNDTVDCLAKAACGQNLPVVCSPPSLRYYRNILYSVHNAQAVNHRNTERATSVSIQHYDHFIDTVHKYRCHGFMVRRHNVVSARHRLGYRPVWQVSKDDEVPQYFTWKLCHIPNVFLKVLSYHSLYFCF